MKLIMHNKFKLLMIYTFFLPVALMGSARNNMNSETIPLVPSPVNGMRPQGLCFMAMCAGTIGFFTMLAHDFIHKDDVAPTPFPPLPEPGQGCNYITMATFSPKKSEFYMFGPTCDSYDKKSSITKKCPNHVEFWQSGQDKIMCQSWPRRCYSEKQVNDTFPKWCATIPQSSNIKRRHTKLMRLQREINNSTAKRKTSAERKQAYRITARNTKNK